MTYTIKTPHELYKGITEGVPFSKGIGQTDDENIRNVLVNDYKYEDITEYPEEEVNSVTETGEGDIENASSDTETDEDDTENTVSDTDTDTETEQDTAKEEATESEEVDLNELTVPELKAEAKRLNLTNYSKLTQNELIELIETAP